MEVSQLSHQDTHAVIGGYQPESFQVNANAEFFEMLSSTMYPNKKLAVVREVLSNSWDAHIMAGKTDVPVEVTITDKEMTFKDFGPGIGRAQIIENYCTYGGSTKKHDGKQTGGFGLGSKAPFAYSKHFTVTSCHNGLRSIYAASRGSIETEGKPDFRAMVADLPTTETGITVTIPVAGAQDAETFKRLVTDLAFLGGINCLLNGVQLNRIDYSAAELPLILAMRENIGGHHRDVSRVYVRYGAVVYPVDRAVEEIHTTLETCQLLNILMEERRLILFGEPDTLTPAPSRETLSYTKGTTAAICKLLTEAEAALQASMNDIGRIMNDGLFRFTVNKNHPLGIYCTTLNESAFVDSFERNPCVFKDGPLLLSREDILVRVAASLVSHRHYSYSTAGKIFQKLYDKKLRLRVRKRLRAKHRELKKAFNRADLDKNRRHKGARKGVCMAPIYEKAESSITRFANGITDRFNVAVTAARAEWDSITDASMNGFVHRILEAELTASRTMRNLLGDIAVFVAPSRAAAYRHYKSAGMRSSGKDMSNLLLVLLSKKSDADGVVAHLTSLGLKVFDSRAHVAKRAKAPSTPAITYHLTAAGASLNEQPCTEANIYDPETSTACWHIPAKIKHDDRLMSNKTVAGIDLNIMCLEYIRDHIGLDKVVMSSNAVHARWLERRGVKPIVDVIAERIIERAKDPKAQPAWAFGTDLLPAVRQMQSLIGNTASRVPDFEHIPFTVMENLGDTMAKTGYGLSISASDRALIRFCERIASNRGVSTDQIRDAGSARQALEEVRTLLMPLVKNTVRAMATPTASHLNDMLRSSYYANKMNPVVLTAMITVSLQTAMVQDAIANATIKG